jgi:sugar lactone lactonase YvrE
MSRRGLTVLLAALLLAAVPVAPSAASSTASSGAARTPVDRIDLPTGWQPEGITTDGRHLYAGSLATGALLRADPRTGRVHVLPQSATGKPAVGIDYDRRRDVLWVAGGASNEIRVQKAGTGRLLRTYTFPSGTRFVNDLVVTRRAVYATDSRNAVLGVVRLRPGRHHQLPPSGQVELLPLSGDFVQAPEVNNANGIVSAHGWLLVIQSNTGKLLRVDPATGRASEVDLGGATLTRGDGLELDGRTLYVVRNRDNLVAVVELSCDLDGGQVVDEIRGDVDVPTTAALVGGDLWVVNARFGVAEPATQSYWMTRLLTSR